MIAIQFEARKIGLIAEYKKTQEHRDREFELANKCIALVQQKDQIDEEIDQIDANIISQQERHASQQQSFIDDQKRKGKCYFRLQSQTGSNARSFFRNGFNPIFSGRSFELWIWSNKEFYGIWIIFIPF